MHLTASGSVIAPSWFLNVEHITVPKEVRSLPALWEEMREKQLKQWARHRYHAHDVDLHMRATVLLQKAKQANEAGEESEAVGEFRKLFSEFSDIDLYGVLRELHLRSHLEAIEKEANALTTPREQIKSGKGILDSKLILESFLQFLKDHGTEGYEEFLGSTVMRLVSTVHPNETERHTNLMHYASLLEKYIDWKKNFASIHELSPNASEFRIRREALNHIRRELKAEIEGVWQSDQLRRNPIPVKSEADRILDRYRMLFRAYPMFVKFVKFLAKEAYWLYQASVYAAQSKEWLLKFQELYAARANTREGKLRAIKLTFRHLHAHLKPPKIRVPIISFGTWKGGDRDGNPFVVASFSNQTFIDQKEFVLQRYIEMTEQLLDKLTPATDHVPITTALASEVVKDAVIFPYIENVKSFEPYRSKVRFILEKLQNTLARVQEVKQRAGETVKPLLGLTLPGPTGYTNVSELSHDIQLLRDSLLANHGKAQARSLLQDLQLIIDGFGFHMASVDFRQTSVKNTEAVREYLIYVEHPLATKLNSLSEKEKQEALLDLMNQPDLIMTPWALQSLSKITRDTFETLFIFLDVAKTDRRALGKFIISMCQGVSDILTLLFLMKLCGMLTMEEGKITHCPFDVTGLFETVEDLIAAPRIITDLLSIPALKDYILNLRGGVITVMMGYSDSVREGSSLASDAQVAHTSMAFKELEDRFNAKLADEFPGQKKRIRFVFYRGRGDTLPRGYGGSISKAIASQAITTSEEDHTEQNRYLRIYSSEASALDHLHRIYSAHVGAQVALNLELSADLPVRYVIPNERYVAQRYFNFFGKLSFVAWNKLVNPKYGPNGTVYFDILNKFSILPHLSKCHFASRPVARDGVTYNIDSIRAIPFTMLLAQLREFTVAFYGTGTAFEIGSGILENSEATAKQLLRVYYNHVKKTRPDDEFAAVLDEAEGLTSFKELLKRQQLLFQLEELDLSPPAYESDQYQPNLFEAIDHYSCVEEAVENIAFLLLDLNKHRSNSVITVLKDLYASYAPFRFSIENKEASLLVRDNRHLKDYTEFASEQQKIVLEQTEKEAHLTAKWVLLINGQDKLFSKTLKHDWRSAELYLLHRIQSRFLKRYIEVAQLPKSPENTENLRMLNVYVQISILAISEGLGFGG